MKLQSSLCMLAMVTGHCTLQIKEILFQVGDNVAEDDSLLTFHS